MFWETNDAAFVIFVGVAVQSAYHRVHLVMARLGHAATNFVPTVSWKKKQLHFGVCPLDQASVRIFGWRMFQELIRLHACSWNFWKLNVVMRPMLYLKYQYVCLFSACVAMLNLYQGRTFYFQRLKDFWFSPSLSPHPFLTHLSMLLPCILILYALFFSK